jgi:hypothetical protein
VKHVTSRDSVGGATQRFVINALPAAMNSSRAAFAKVAESISLNTSPQWSRENNQKPTSLTIIWNSARRS